MINLAINPNKVTNQIFTL